MQSCKINSTNGCSLKLQRYTSSACIAGLTASKQGAEHTSTHKGQNNMSVDHREPRLCNKKSRIPVNQLK